MLKLMEECTGTGDLRRGVDPIGRVCYTIRRYQGVLPSGLPVPGLHRLEGTLDLPAGTDAAPLVGAALALTLEDGRTLGVTLADAGGRVLTEGHGPFGCSCC
jgi:hypothetical protein